LTPNWRERLICPLCQLNNRTRAAIDIFQQTCKSSKRSRIYLTEQLTPLYQWFSARFPQAIGSEFLGNQIQFGQCNEQGIRNEDLTQLSFADNELDSILSFDVLEHVPDYMQALSECLRCLKPGGVLLLSVPFSQVSVENILRAYHDESGELHHLLPPDYHGDPVNPDGGCLCYYYFGWSLLDNLRALGYCDVQALFYWSEKYAYLGGEQILLVAKKPE
ncbi:MAG TPA: class I SAM-dependent methyltransferase, partial [Cellvibrionaceae bacterium]